MTIRNNNTTNQIINKFINRRINLIAKNKRAKSIISNMLEDNWILKYQNNSVLCLDNKPGFLLENGSYLL